jgi:hypothetical protein
VRHLRGIGASIALALLIFGGCGGSSPSGPSGPTLTGAITDPAGDAVPRVPPTPSPDLVAATIDVTGGNLAVTLTFAPGTLSQTQILASLLLDTDENPRTGSPGVDSDGNDASLIGVDYLIQAVTPRASAQAIVRRALGPNQFTTAGTASVTFPGADQLRVVVPLSLLGGDEGRVRFAATSSQWLTDTTTTGIADYMPNLGQAPGTVR